jgi:hypothetical protein
MPLQGQFRKPLETFMPWKKNWASLNDRMCFLSKTRKSVQESEGIRSMTTKCIQLGSAPLPGEPNF